MWPCSKNHVVFILSVSLIAFFVRARTLTNTFYSLCREPSGESWERVVDCEADSFPLSLEGAKEVVEVSHPHFCHWRVWGPAFLGCTLRIVTYLPDSNIHSPEPNLLAKLLKTRGRKQSREDKGRQKDEEKERISVFSLLCFDFLFVSPKLWLDVAEL